MTNFWTGWCAVVTCDIKLRFMTLSFAQWCANAVCSMELGHWQLQHPLALCCNHGCSHVVSLHGTDCQRYGCAISLPNRQPFPVLEIKHMRHHLSITKGVGEFSKWMLKVPGFGSANATLLRISTPGKGTWQARDSRGAITGDNCLQATGRGGTYEEKGKQHKGNWKPKWWTLPNVVQHPGKNT